MFSVSFIVAVMFVHFLLLFSVDLGKTLPAQRKVGGVAVGVGKINVDIILSLPIITNTDSS